jgi:hypothetical protein
MLVLGARLRYGLGLVAPREDPMHSRKERLEMADAGRKFYELIRPGLERNQAGKTVVISVMTGSYVVVDDPKEAALYAESLQLGDTIWMKKIGEK